jgi:transposase
MPRTLPLADHLCDHQIDARYRACRNVTERAHWQVLRLKTQGHTLNEIAAATGYTSGWVSTLIHRYNHRGPDAMRDRRHDHPGAPPMLDAEQQVALDEVLASGKAPDGGLWNGPKVARWIEQTTGREHVHDQRGWEWLVRLGFSAQTPRPHHDHADAAAQAAFKKHARG